MKSPAGDFFSSFSGKNMFFKAFTCVVVSLIGETLFSFPTG